MSKLKNFKVSFKHLLMAVSLLGLVGGFIGALFSKKKAASTAAFFVSFAGLIAGLGMDQGLIPEPKCCKKVEVDFDDDADWSETMNGEDDWSFLDDDGEDVEDGEDGGEAKEADDGSAAGNEED